MKKFVITAIAFIGVFTVFAQMGKDPKVKAILDEVSKTIRSYSSFQAEFTSLIENKSNGTKEETTGKLKVKGDKYHITFSDGHEMICDGQSIWDYYPEDQGNTVTIYEVDPEEGGLNSPQKVADMYKEGYKYWLKGDEVMDGVKYTIIDLEPDLSPQEKKHNQVYKIRLHVDQSKNILKKWKIFEKNGNRFSVEIKGFKSNVNIPNTEFTFDIKKHPGVTVEDMR